MKSANMPGTDNVHSDALRAMFAQALSEMYRREVPQYGTLLELVSDINQRQSQGQSHDTQHRLEVERHGAIRLGTAAELATICRLFAILGMQPVGYYDLTVAGLPVHATCFRPLTQESLAINPFRVFTSLLRLDLIQDQSLRAQAAEILSKRQIFTPRCLELIGEFEKSSAFTEQKAQEFLAEAVETFRWHKTSTVDMGTYQALQSVHPLVADIICFRGPHINHLTPRVADIEAAQIEMQIRGLKAKDSIEGPPPMDNPVLLRQTSFLALEEEISFSDGAEAGGRHKARFGEIEQRGMALTPKGRRLYDETINRWRELVARDSSEQDPSLKRELLVECFRSFPDDLKTLRKEKLAYFTYSVARRQAMSTDSSDVEFLIDSGILTATPITYEDFLPVSAAGIFHSNLGANIEITKADSADQSSFEKALGRPVHNEFKLYSSMEGASLAQCLDSLMN